MNDTALKAKPCELCLKTFYPGRPEQRICDECLGVKPYPLSSVPDPVPAEICTCKVCGEEFDEYVVGKAHHRNKCMTCRIDALHAARRKSSPLRCAFASRRKRPAPTPDARLPEIPGPPRRDPRGGGGQL